MESSLQSQSCVASTGTIYNSCLLQLQQQNEQYAKMRARRFKAAFVGSHLHNNNRLQLCPATRSGTWISSLCFRSPYGLYTEPLDHSEDVCSIRQDRFQTAWMSLVSVLEISARKMK